MFQYLQIIISTIVFLLISGCQLVIARNAETCPENVAAIATVKLAIELLNQGYRQEAQQKLLLAKKIAPRNPCVWYSIGYFYEKVGELTQANKNYQYALILAPQSGAANNNYGVFLYHIGQYQQALKYFRLAIASPNYLATGAAYRNAGLCAEKIPNKNLAAYYFHKALNYTEQ